MLISDFEPKISIGKVMLFGIKVNDFKSIDYNQITAINTQAIKELYENINDLITRLSILENKLL